MSEVINLFSVPLYRTKFNIDNEKILQYCLSLEKTDPGRIISNLGGYQSNDIDGTPPELQELFSLITAFSTNICEKMEIYPVRMFNSWVNINRYKDMNWPHTHSDAIISGVYYVKTPYNCGDIEFENPASDSINPFLRWYDSNCFHACNWKMPTEEGLLYLFPSWLRHGVNPNFNKEEDRVSISFNLVH